MANLQHLKGSRTQILNGFPANSFGNDGDIVLVNIKGKGAYLCVKNNSRWFVANKLNDLRQLDKPTMQKLKLDSLSIKNLTLTKDELKLSTGVLTLNADGVSINTTKKLYFDGGGDTYISEYGGDTLLFTVGNAGLLRLAEAGGGASDKVSIPAQAGLYFDGGGVSGNTYIHERSADKLEIVVGGDEMVTLDEANQRITLEASKLSYHIEGGTEFSATDSAYAGMILGYSVYRNSTASVGANQVDINTTMSVLETADGNKINVSFVAPPSGKVELIFSAMLYASSKEVWFSLSDNATYNEVDAIHTYDDNGVKADETDYISLYLPFVIQGLTAGTSYQYWIAGDSSTGTAYIYHGADRSDVLNTQPITFKAIALPATIVSEE